MFFPASHQPRRASAEDAQEDEHPAERGAEKDRRIAVGEIQRTAQAVFTYRTQDQTQHDGGCVQIKLANEVADDAENEHDDHFHKVVVDSKRTYNAKQEDGRNQDRVGKTGDLSKHTAADETDTQHRKLNQHETGKECVGHRSVSGEELRSRLQTVNDQTAHQHSGHGFTRNTER